MQKKATALIVSTGLAGAVAGGVLMGTLSANAADGSSGSSGTSSYAAPPVSHGAGPNGNTDPTKPMRSDEKLLTGATKDKVTAAVKAKYPSATFQRVETDSDGVYEAHVLLDGKPVIVEVDASFAVTGTQSMPAGPRGGDHDGDGPRGQAHSGQAPSGQAPSGQAPAGQAPAA